MKTNIFIPAGEETARILSGQHWKYVESVIMLHGENSEIMRKCGEHYIKAFIHGFKHGIEYARVNAEIT